MTSAIALGPTCITGASGFVGRALLPRLDGDARQLRLSAADWESEIRRADFRDATIFHLAARVHDAGASDDAFMRDNAAKTEALARAARAGGARRFVFLSTIKVNGEETARPFTATDPARPEDAYARSKWAAEQALAAVEGLEGVVVRCPLVFGPGAKGNLRALLALADTPWPLPFGAIDNRRSFIHVDDLARILLECAMQPQAAGRTILAAHPQPASTTGIVSEMRRSLGRPRRLFGVPAPALEGLAGFAGAGEKMRRMTRSLEVDCTGARQLLGWSAQVALAPAVDTLVAAYREART